MVYFGSLNIVDGIIVSEYELLKSSELSFVKETNKIYANCECEIHEVHLMKDAYANTQM